MNVETARLVALVDCEACAGTGAKVSEDWEAFEQWRQRHPAATPEAAEHEPETYFLEVCGYDAVPPMREDCEACDGSGTMQAEVPVRELLAFVLEHVNRPPIRTADIDDLVDRIKKTITSAAFKTDGMADGFQVNEWLRVVQEGAHTLESLRRLRPERSL